MRQYLTLERKHKLKQIFLFSLHQKMHKYGYYYNIFHNQTVIIFVKTVALKLRKVCKHVCVDLTIWYTLFALKSASSEIEIL